MEFRITADRIAGAACPRGSTGHLHASITSNAAITLHAASTLNVPRQVKLEGTAGGTHASITSNAAIILHAASTLNVPRQVKLEGTAGGTLCWSYQLVPPPSTSHVSIAQASVRRLGVTARCRIVNASRARLLQATFTSNLRDFPSSSRGERRKSKPLDLGSEVERRCSILRRNSTWREWFLLVSAASVAPQSAFSATRKFISGAAAAGMLSLTLCSSALASPVSVSADGLNERLVMSSDVETHVERQLRREVRAHIALQGRMEEEDDDGGQGQPPSAWAIDDRVRRALEAGSRKSANGSGKAVARSEVPDCKIASVGTAGLAPREASREKAGGTFAPRSSGGPGETVQLLLPAQPSLDRAPPEVRAMAAGQLGTVVSAATRTMGSSAASTVTVVQASAGAGASASARAAPAVSLLPRIMMHLGGGGVAGAMGATLVYPLDTIKTRMQAQSNDDEESYKDEWDCFGKLLATEGPGSLYSGLLPQLVGIAPEKAMKLTVNDVLMDMLEGEMPGVGAWALELIAGGGGGFSQVVFTNPMEIVKVRLQTQAKDVQQKNSWDVIKELGFKGLYDGASVTMARDIPSTAIFFAIYTFIRQIYPDQSFMAGFVAAIPATVLVTPLDVIKTRVQMEKKTAGQEQYENGYVCFTKILREEGVGALFTGSLARVLKTSPQFGITLMMYNIICGNA